MDHGEREQEDEEVGDNVQTGVAPVDRGGMAKSGGTFGRVPERVQGNASCKKSRKNVDVADEDDAENDLCRKAYIVVNKNANIQTENG